MINEDILHELIEYINRKDVSFKDALDKADRLFLVYFLAKDKQELLLDIKYFILTYGHYPKCWELPFFISHKRTF